MASSSNRNLYFAATVACTTACLFGYAVGFIGGVLVLPSFQQHFNLDKLSPHDLASAQAMTVTSWLIGTTVGVVLGMPVYQKWGRRWCLFICGGLYLVGAGMQVGNFGRLGVFDSGRFLNGVGVGAGTLVSPLYISEISTPELRGMLMSGFQVAVQVSALIGFWGAFISNEIFPATSQFQYQIPVALQFVPGILLVAGTVLIPEAPRFLAEREKSNELRSAIAWLRGRSTDDSQVNREMEEIWHAVEANKALQTMKKKSFVREIMAPGLRKRLMVGVGLMIAQNMAGLNAINYYAPVIFKSAGFTSVPSMLFLTGLFGLVKLVAAIAFMFVFVRIRGNRFWLQLGSAVCSVSMLILAVCIWHMGSPKPGSGTSLSFEGLLSVAAVYVFSFFFGVSLGPISWNVCGEIFPLHLTAKCCTITTFTQWLFQIVIASMTPLLITRIGWGTYLVYGLFCLASLVWCWAVVPETRDLPLTEMSKLFDDDDKSDETPAFEEIEEVAEVSERTALLGSSQRRHRRSSVALIV